MSGWSMRRKTWVVAPLQLVMFSSSESWMIFAGSKRPIGQTLVPPPASVAVVLPIEPDRWKSGKGARVAPGSPAGGSVIARRAPMKKLDIVKPTSVRWDTRAPFGRPVVPEVKRRRHGSSSSIGVSGSAAPGAKVRIASKSCSKETTGISGARSISASRSLRRSSTSRSFGFDRSSPYWISSPCHQPFIEITTPPRETVAQ